MDSVVMVMVTQYVFKISTTRKEKKKEIKYIYIYMMYKTILCFFSKATLNKMLVFPNQTNGMCWTCGHDR